MKSRSILVCLLLGLVALGRAADAPPDELRLRYEVVTEEIAGADSLLAGPGLRDLREIAVGFGEDYFYVHNGDRWTVYDFARRRLIYLDQRSQTYEEYSLYAAVALMRKDFLFRLELAEITAADAGTRARSVWEVETLYSMLSDMATLNVIEMGEEGNLRYLVQNEPVVEVSPSDWDIPAAYRSMWAKFLLYECRLHPDIRRGIAARPVFPAFLSYRYRDFAGLSVEMKLLDVQTAPAAGTAIPEGFSPLINTRDRLSVLIHDITAGQNETPRLPAAEYQAMIRTAHAEGHYLNALLAYIEGRWQYGDDMPGDEERLLHPHIQADPLLELCLGISQASTVREPADSIAALKAVDRGSLVRGHVLDMLLAAETARLGEGDKAAEIFLDVLGVNPYLAGVYFKLGEIAHRGGEYIRAWQCWDFARELAPRHFMRFYYDRYDREVRSDCPEFF